MTDPDPLHDLLGDVVGDLRAAGWALRGGLWRPPPVMAATLREYRGQPDGTVEKVVLDGLTLAQALRLRRVWKALAE